MTTTMRRKLTWIFFLSLTNWLCRMPLMQRPRTRRLAVMLQYHGRHTSVPGVDVAGLLGALPHVVGLADSLTPRKVTERQHRHLSAKVVAKKV